jgi:hypothetical protein
MSMHKYNNYAIVIKVFYVTIYTSLYDNVISFKYFCMFIDTIKNIEWSSNEK